MQSPLDSPPDSDDFNVVLAVISFIALRFLTWDLAEILQQSGHAITLPISPLCNLTSKMEISVHSHEELALCSADGTDTGRFSLHRIAAIGADVVGKCFLAWAQAS